MKSANGPRQWPLEVGLKKIPECGPQMCPGSSLLKASCATPRRPPLPLPSVGSCEIIEGAGFAVCQAFVQGELIFLWRPLELGCVRTRSTQQNRLRAMNVLTGLGGIGCFHSAGEGCGVNLCEFKFSPHD